MPILLKDIWPIENLADYKIHFARYNQHSQPLEVWVSINTAPKSQTSILDGEEARNLLKPLNNLDTELYNYAKVLYAQTESEIKNISMKNKIKRFIRKVATSV